MPKRRTPLDDAFALGEDPGQAVGVGVVEAEEALDAQAYATVKWHPIIAGGHGRSRTVFHLRSQRLLLRSRQTTQLHRTRSWHPLLLP